MVEDAHVDDGGVVHRRVDHAQAVGEGLLAEFDVGHVEGGLFAEEVAGSGLKGLLVDVGRPADRRVLSDDRPGGEEDDEGKELAHKTR